MTDSEMKNIVGGGEYGSGCSDDCSGPCGEDGLGRCGWTNMGSLPKKCTCASGGLG